MGLSGAGCGWATMVFCGSWVSAMDRGSWNFCISAVDFRESWVSTMDRGLWVSVVDRGSFFGEF